MHGMAFGIFGIAAPLVLCALSVGTAFAALVTENRVLPMAYLVSWPVAFLACAAISIFSIIRWIRRGPDAGIIRIASISGPICCIFLIASGAGIIYVFSLVYAD